MKQNTMLWKHGIALFPLKKSRIRLMKSVVSFLFIAFSVSGHNIFARETVDQLNDAAPSSLSVGFLQGSALTLLNRNLYLNRDYRNPEHIGKSYLREWGQSINARFESGFTAGPIGFGVDAHAMFALRLDSGRGRSGARMFPVDSDGQARKEFSKAGGTIKLRVSETVLKYGTQFVHLPVLSTDDSRLLPESVQGVLLTSREREGLEVNFGHFTALSTIYQNGRDSIVADLGKGLKTLDLAGASYRFNDVFDAALYFSDVGNYWRKRYLRLHYQTPLSDRRSLDVDFNYYGVKSQGDFNHLSPIDSDNWSLAVRYGWGAHGMMMGYQNISGKGGMPLDIDGGDTIRLTNSAIFSDFNHEGEKSWQLRYDLDLTSMGIPGLNLSVGYVRGADVAAHQRRNPRLGRGKEWERDIALTWRIASGRFKDTTLKLRQFSYRPSGFSHDMDEIRFMIEYPLKML